MIHKDTDLLPVSQT